MSAYTRVTSSIGEQLNTTIVTGFLDNYQRDDIRKTHEFEGRYENIYLDEQHIPALKPLITEAVTHAEHILDIEHLRAGYWFNFMPPGSLTLAHHHDDYDELLSAVYYVAVPQDSGKLIIHDVSDRHHESLIEIEPRAGDFIFFDPATRHEVSRNNSQQSRLSIGINFGQPHEHK